MLINFENHSMFSSYEIEDEKILNQRKKIFIDKRNNEIKLINKNLKSKFQIFEKQHTSNSNLSFLNNEQ